MTSTSFNLPENVSNCLLQKITFLFIVWNIQFFCSFFMALEWADLCIVLIRLIGLTKLLDEMGGHEN